MYGRIGITGVKARDREKFPNPDGVLNCGYAWCIPQERMRPILSCWYRAMGLDGHSNPLCKRCTRWVDGIREGSVLFGITKDKLREEMRMQNEAAKTDDQGNYTGVYAKVSEGVRKLYEAKPKCPVCEEVFLYTKAAQEQGICSRCKAAQEKEKKRKEEAVATAATEVATAATEVAKDGEDEGAEPEPTVNKKSKKKKVATTEE
jgi:DNA-directed RNA polymerase subunit M/transcription elongation factor TFIIS